MQLFLVLTNILAEYTLSLPKGDKGELGTQFKVCTKRSQYSLVILLCTRRGQPF